MKTRTITVVLALFMSYVWCFGQDPAADVVNSKHEEFSKYINLLVTQPDKSGRKKLLKNVSSILDNNTVAEQHLVEKTLAKRFPVEFQYKRFLFFKGKAKKTIRYVSTLSEIDSVKYIYNVVGTAEKDTLAPKNAKFQLYETKGEAKVNTAQRRNKNSKKFLNSETKNVLTLVWKVDSKNKARIESIYAEPVDFFNFEIAEMQQKASALVEKYYSNLIVKESIPEMRASTVQDEFSGDHKQIAFWNMFGGNPYIKIANLSIAPSGVTKFNDEPIMIVDVAREAYFNEGQTLGNKLGLRFAIAFNKEFNNARIVKIEWMFGEKVEPENMFGAKNLKDAQQFGESFIQKLKKHIVNGATDKALEAELTGMFLNDEAIVEVSSIRSTKVTPHKVKEYFASLTQNLRGRSPIAVEIVSDKPTSFSGTSIIEMKFKQAFKGGKYCDNTEKRIEMVYEEGKYSITKVAVIETKECKK